MEAVEQYLHEGGRLMYLGGNGFYWRSGWHAELPGVIEVRRGPTGTRCWMGAPGEDVLATSGEVGGSVADEWSRAAKSHRRRLRQPGFR